jgi:DNA-directed RNA polymerase specialized sigma24 family protein
VLPHEPQLRFYLQRAFPAVRDVDDVVQESYFRIWRKHGAKPTSCARAFLFRIARNFAIDLLREDRRAPAADLGISGVETAVDDGADTLEQI